MSIEQVVDAYLQAAHQILGSTPPDGTPPADPGPPPLPPEDWTGNAKDAAVQASAALHQARGHLYDADKNVADLTASAGQITKDAQKQLDAIAADWKTDKNALAAAPPNVRDVALLAAAQSHISQAVTLISATAAKFDQAADKVRAHAATLPGSPDQPHGKTNPGPTPTPPLQRHPPAGGHIPDHNRPPPTTGGLATTTPGAPGLLDPAAMAPAAAGMIPAAVGPLAGAPAALTPMAAGLPAAAATPLSSLGSLANQLNPAAGDPSSHGIRASGGHRNSNVDTDIDIALDALGITDPEARARWHAGYDTLIASESSNNSAAVNTWDTNAVGPIQPDGAPAGADRGYTQLTPDTFRQYRLPTLRDDIYDGPANIAASMRYVMAEYKVDPSGIDLAAKVQQANSNKAPKGY
jgi:hypothetical protein